MNYDIMKKRVLNVGHCGPDHRAIATMLEHHFAADVAAADSLAQTLEMLRAQSFDLVLVNRVFDRNGSDGLEVIRQIKAAPDLAETPLMMITNFPDHQQRAQDAGALEGFGKQALHTSETHAKLKPLLS